MVLYGLTKAQLRAITTAYSVSFEGSLEHTGHRAHYAIVTCAQTEDKELVMFPAGNTAVVLDHRNDKQVFLQVRESYHKVVW